MSFVSGGFNYGAGVVQQSCAGGWVWAQRMARQGSNPAPACVCIPASSKTLAVAAKWLLRRQGWQAWARPGKRTAAVAEVKVVVPECWSVSQVRSALSWLIELHNAGI